MDLQLLHPLFLEFFAASSSQPFQEQLFVDARTYLSTILLLLDHLIQRNPHPLLCLRLYSIQR